MGALCSKDNDDVKFGRREHHATPTPRPDAVNPQKAPVQLLRQNLIQPGRLMKLHMTFKDLDRNSDGLLSWDEFATMGRAVHGPCWDPTQVLQQFRGMVCRLHPQPAAETYSLVVCAVSNA